jgi:cysteine desulfurase family protein
MIYLNNAATTFPKPESVVKAVTEYLGSTPFHCLRTGRAGEENDLILSCREKLAMFFNAESPQNIVFTSGATESLNLVIQGLGLEGGHVVTTAVEHNSVLRPLRWLEKEKGVELSIVNCDSFGHVDPDDIGKKIRKDTKAVIVNHCSNVTGEILDLDTVSDVCSSSKALFVVDAAQSAGCVPIDVRKNRIDLLAFTGHKSLYGIPGIGGLYIRGGISLKPLKFGGTGIQSELLDQPEDASLKYEAGTPNVPGIVSLDAGIGFVIKTGINVIEEKKKDHINKIVRALQEIPNIRVYGRNDLNNRAPLFCFNVVGVSPEGVGNTLENNYGIVTRSGLHCAPLLHKVIGTYPEGAVRVSPSYFTTDEEIDKFVYAIKEICWID